MRILIVEDEPDLASSLRKFLAGENYVVDLTYNLEEAKSAVRIANFDLVLLDRLLPDGDGDNLIAYIRNNLKQHPPILMLTAMGDVQDRVSGLDTGADDYMVKPVDRQELLARIRALLRRPNIVRSATISCGNIEYETADRHVKIAGQGIQLPRGENIIIGVLIEHANRVVMREHLESAVYNYDDIVQSNSLDAQISRLRKRLKAAESDTEIRPIRGVGYMMRQKEK